MHRFVVNRRADIYNRYQVWCLGISLGALCRPAAKCKSLRGRLFQVRSKFAKRGTTGLGSTAGSRIVGLEGGLL